VSNCPGEQLSVLCLKTGVIIPIMKKAILDPNIPEHYRPISLSSTYSKLFKSIIMPDVTLNNNQFGFRKGCGTSFGIGLLNESPMCICSLDAEIYFFKFFMARWSVLQITIVFP